MDTLPWEGFYTAAQLARWHHAMPRRFSCRAFSGQPEVSRLAALEYAAERCALRGVRIALSARDAGDLVIPLPLFPRFEGVGRYAAVFTRPGTETADLLAGVSGEAFALELAAMGLSGCWMAGNYRRAIPLALAREGEKLAAVIPFGVPADPEGARHRRRKPLSAFCPDDPAGWPLWAYQAAEAMRSAPSAVNRQPWKISYAGNTLSFTGARLDSVDTGIAVLHLESAVHAMDRGWRLSRDGKSLLLQTGEQDEPV